MASAPFIRSLGISGGTFVAFSSGARDLSYTINNSNQKFVFSKFALLNLPDIGKLDFASFGTYDNLFQLDTIDGTILNGVNLDINLGLVESLQNYALNLEAMILSNPNYNSDLNQSVAERVFFKWLKEVGAIRFRDSLDVEAASSILGDSYVEEDPKTTGNVKYQRVVQYVGDLDIVNHVQKAGESYTEVYVLVPTGVGNTPTVLFKSLEDDNYQADLVWTGLNEFLQGRGGSSIHPENLSINAFYDYDAAVTYTDPNANWYNQPSGGGLVDSYFTEPTVMTDSSNIDIKKYPLDYSSPSGFTGVAYRRSKLDGISIDFEAENYQAIVTDPAISTIAEFNASAQAADFEFNAILIYYDFYDISAPEEKATNLYGILFLDNVTPTIDGGYIQRFQKFKPNPVTKLNGNSYGLTLNLKIDTSVTNSGVETIVNEYNNFSMGLFVDAITQLQTSAALFLDQKNEINDINAKIAILENSVYSVTTIQNFQARIIALEKLVANSQAAFSSNSTLLDLIASNSDKINQIVRGTTPLVLQYNTDVITAGPGILIDKSVPNKVKITNKQQEYNFTNPYDTSSVAIDILNPYDLNVSAPEINFDLIEFTNMVRIYTENTALNNVSIVINNKSYKFKKGQTIRLVFPTALLLGNYELQFYTDFANTLGFGSLEAQIGVINSNDLLSSKPIIELICVDETNLEFEIDILR